MRASRLVSLILLLQSHGRMTAQDLADWFEVSVRTIYRDVEALHAAGVPIYGDAGHAGGYQLFDGYRTRLTGLTTSEAEVLFLAGMPGPAADLGLGAVVASAQLKVLAALPAKQRDRAWRIAECFHLDAQGWYQDADPTPYLAAVADAVWHQRRVELRYRRWQAPQEVTRRLEPYGLVLKGGRWYLVARADRHVRTYRVSQILDLRQLDGTFTRPDSFDLAAYWRCYLNDFEARRLTSTALIRLSSRVLPRLPDLVTHVMARAVTTTAGPPDEEGWVRALVPIESTEHAVADLLRLGAEAEVLTPDNLRARVADTVQRLAKMYESPALH
jgi:predicted DNA-binding transcriptional regulator YafY